MTALEFFSKLEQTGDTITIINEILYFSSKISKLLHGRWLDVVLSNTGIITIDNDYPVIYHNGAYIIKEFRIKVEDGNGGYKNDL